MTDSEKKEEGVEDVELEEQAETTTTEKEEGGGVSMGKIHISDAQVYIQLIPNHLMKNDVPYTHTP